MFTFSCIHVPRYHIPKGYNSQAKMQREILDYLNLTLPKGNPKLTKTGGLILDHNVKWNLFQMNFGCNSNSTVEL